MHRWPLRPLAEVSENLDALRVPVKEADRKPGPYPYFGASGIVDFVDNFIFDGTYVLVAEDGENLRTRKTPIAFLARGKFWVNNHAHVLQGNGTASTRFLAYALADADVRSFLTGSTMPKLTRGNLDRVPVSAPPLAEQGKVAGLLGALDDKVELNRRMNETLEAMTKATYREWFGRFELGGATPPGWSSRSIGDVVTVRGGSTPPTSEPTFWNGEHAFATPKDLSRLTSPVLLEAERNITEEGITKTNSGLLPPGTVLLSSRAPIGYLAISEIPVTVNQGFIAMVCDRELPNLYVLRWAQSNADVIVGAANGTTFLEISKRNFCPLPILVPPRDLLDKFVNVAGPLHRRVVANLHESRTLATLRDALLPKLISGELRIRDAQRIV